MKFVGLARTETEVVNLSQTSPSGLKGIAGVIGVTEFGEPNKPKLIGSWIEYQRNFGGLLPDSQFPYLCKRALDGGARLRISPVGHYTDIADPTTLEGAKATGTLIDGADRAVINAVWTGEAGNKITVTTVDAANGVPDQVDMVIEVAGFAGEVDLTQRVYNIPSAPTAEEKSQLNAGLKLIQLGAITNLIPVATITLAGGARDITDIVSQDYIGDAASSTGLHSFDNFPDIRYVAVPEKAMPAIDIAISEYVTLRKGTFGVVRTPVGIDGVTATDYRYGRGVYSHQAIDNWRMLMTFGGLKAVHPRTLELEEITEIADMLALFTRKDSNNYEWITFAGPKRGKITNAQDVVYNLYSPARSLEAAQVDMAGINPVINHEAFGVVAWGNGTLHMADDLLKHANVAALVLLLEKDLPRIIQTELFEPNDIETWKGIYLRVKPYMEDIESNRGVWKWKYEGDQDIDNISEATVNEPANIDVGGYKFRLWIAPKVGMKYIGIEIGVTNSNVEFNLIQG